MLADQLQRPRPSLRVAYAMQKGVYAMICEANTVSRMRANGKQQRLALVSTQIQLTLCKQLA